MKLVGGPKKTNRVANLLYLHRYEVHSVEDVIEDELCRSLEPG